MSNINVYKRYRKPKEQSRIKTKNEQSTDTDNIRHKTQNEEKK